MQLSDFRTNLQFVIGFNNGQINQDFNGNLAINGTTVTQIDWLINQAYQREVELGQVNGTIRWFRQHTTGTWPAGQTTFVLPVDVTQNQIIALVDETNGLPGYSFVVSEVQDLDGLFWLDYKTLQWGTVGPGADVLVGIEYIAGAETLVNATDVPKWIPPQHHQVILWSAAVLARELADEAAPAAWYQNLKERRESYWAYIMTSKPMRGHAFIDEGDSAF